MGVACIVNALRCGRVHCYLTGPFFLLMAVIALKPRPALGSFSALSGRRERTDRNVISVRISERELLGLSVRIHVWLLFEPQVI
jgi:hypothetical protein